LDTLLYQILHNKQEEAASWIFDLNFFKRIFLFFPDQTQTRYPRSFWISLKKLKIAGGNIAIDRF
jgi:hypothetical protein